MKNFIRDILLKLLLFILIFMAIVLSIIIMVELDNSIKETATTTITKLSKNFKVGHFCLTFYVNCLTNRLDCDILMKNMI